MLGLLREKYTPENLPYHVIVPSLPGYAFSSAQNVSEDLTRDDTARVLDKVMRQLGFSTYIAQGGDVGSGVARSMGVQFEACKGESCFDTNPVLTDLHSGASYVGGLFE